MDLIERVLYILIILGMLWYVFLTENHCSVLTTQVEEYQMGMLIAGYNHNGNFYTVFTDMAWIDTNATDYHEACHSLVYKEKEHYCG